MSQIPLRTRAFQCPAVPPPPNFPAYDNPSALALDFHRYGQDAENFGKGMQGFATQINEILKINIAPRFYYNSNGWVCEFDFPATKQHNALVDATIDRANNIIEFMELKEFALQPNSPVKKTPVRSHNGENGGYATPSAAARPGREWPLFQAEAEGVMHLVSAQEDRFAAHQKHTKVQERSSAQAEAEAEGTAFREAVEVEKRADRAEHQKKQAEAEAERQKEALFSRGASRAIRGSGIRGGGVTQSFHDSMSVDRSITAGSTPAPRDLESMSRMSSEAAGGSSKKAPAIKAESVTPEAVIAPPAKKRAPAKARAPKTPAATKTTAARGGVTKAKNANPTTRKRASKKQAVAGESTANPTPRKRTKKNGEATQAPRMSVGNGGQKGENVEASGEVEHGFRNQIAMDFNAPTHAEQSMAPMQFQNTEEQNDMGDQFEQYIRDNAFEGRNMEQTGLGAGVDALLSFNEDKPEQRGEPEKLLTLLARNRHGDEPGAMMFGNGEAQHTGHGNGFEMDNTFGASMAEHAVHPQNFESFQARDNFAIGNAGHYGVMDQGGAVIMNGMGEQAARTDGSLSEDQFWHAPEAGTTEGFQTLLGESTYEADMGGRGGGGGDSRIEYTFQEDFEDDC